MHELWLVLKTCTKTQRVYWLCRFGVWEAAKWAARARDLTVYDPQRPIVLNMTADIVEDSKYLQTKELAIETAFLLKTVT